MGNTIAENVRIVLQVEGQQGTGSQLQMTDTQVKQLTTSANKLQAATHGVTMGGNQMNMAMGQLGWAMGDASMFMVNFRMGMMSIGNNIPMIVQGMIAAKTEAKSLGMTFMQSLGSSLMGPGGVMVGINLLMFALQVLPGLFGKTKQAVDESTEELKKFTREAQSLSKVKLMQQLTQEENAESYLVGAVGNAGKKERVKAEANLELNRQHQKILRDAIEQLGIVKNENLELEAAKAAMENATTQEELQYRKADVARLEARKRVDIYHHKAPGPTPAELTDRLKNELAVAEAGSPIGAELTALQQWYDTQLELIGNNEEGKNALYELYRVKEGIIRKSYNDDDLKEEARKADEEKRIINQTIRERQQALDQLNRITKDKYDYQLYQLEIWKSDMLKTLPGMSAMIDAAYNKQRSTIEKERAADLKRTAEETKRENEKMWRDQNRTASAALDAMKTGAGSFWDTWLVQGGSIESAWTTMWDRMKVTFLQKIGEMVNDALFSFLLDTFMGIIGGPAAIPFKMIDSVPAGGGTGVGDLFAKSVFSVPGTGAQKFSDMAARQPIVVQNNFKGNLDMDSKKLYFRLQSVQDAVEKY